ncbi:MAG: MORN repeat-containing protein [Parachlamydiaceae bacterium]
MMFISSSSSSGQLLSNHWLAFTKQTDRLLNPRQHKVAVVALVLFAAFTALSYFFSRFARGNQIKEIKRKRMKNETPKTIAFPVKSPQSVITSQKDERIQKSQIGLSNPLTPIKELESHEIDETIALPVKSSQCVITSQKDERIQETQIECSNPLTPIKESENEEEKGSSRKEKSSPPPPFLEQNSPLPLTTPQKISISNETIQGDFTPGLTNGMGKKIIDGDVHQGGFQQGVLHCRQGTITRQDGTEEIGTFSNGQLDGPDGTISNPNHATYTGCFKKGRLHGNGKIEYVNGKIVEGQFEEGKLIQGKIVEANGESWEGTFLKGKLNGSGTHEKPDGSKVVGVFVKGKLDHIKSLEKTDGRSSQLTRSQSFSGPIGSRSHSFINKLLGRNDRDSIESAV